jgi:hypothetical protein
MEGKVVSRLSIILYIEETNNGYVAETDKAQNALTTARRSRNLLLKAGKPLTRREKPFGRRFFGVLKTIFAATP